MKNNSSKYNEIISEIKDVEALNISLREKYIQLKLILERCCKEITKGENLQFPSLFSRIVFIAQKYNLSQSTEWQLQNIRVKASFLLRNEQNAVSLTQYQSAIENITCFISIIYGNRVGDYPSEKTDAKLAHKLQSIPSKIRVQVTDIDRDNKLITAHTENGEQIRIRYDVKKINDTFNSTIDRLWIGAQLNLINAGIENPTACVVPQYIVLEPDYLIDASALAECFQNYGRSHLHYFRRKFETSENTKHILLGNLSNFFLDELIYANNAQDIEFSDTFFKAFKQSPFEFTTCKDIEEKADFIEFMSKAKTQFNNIQRVVINDFSTNNIDTRNCTLEPSFFCEKFGFQGRLDLLQLSDDEKNTTKIVELKSGGLPFPKEDTGKIAINHEAQTSIYRLIIESVFEKQSREISSTILYSASENSGENIRYSAHYQSLEKEIINIRNLIIATEHDLYTKEESGVENIFRQLFDLDNYGRVPQFFIDRIASIEKVLGTCTELERKYLFRYISFISRELYIQKMGDVDYNSSSGTSSLWTTEYNERQENYDLISNLEIDEIDDSGDDMKISFRRKKNIEFVNFRIAEICILYPRDKEADTILSNQILKGNIAEINSDRLVVRFRYKQKNKNYLLSHKLWTIEHDRLDHAYTGMFKSLFSFLKAPISKRSLLLGTEKPKSEYLYTDNQINTVLSIEDKQGKVIEKAVAASDYFLIVGPPGTGKTSIFARRLIELFYANPDNNILVIAYTNRAVDELCDAINLAFNCENGACDFYIRIGTDLSCAEAHKHRLLQHIAKTSESRDELRSMIQRTRIFVGTLASISGKPELFDIKKFNIAIIDEASQILEAQIIGLLPKFDKFIMIGDHKQLSTITLQTEEKAKITDADLNNIELVDCRESYFERLFRICRNNNWTHAYDTLSFQGRMHQDIAYFPNKYFYDNNLKLANNWQKEVLTRSTQDISNPYQQLVANERIAFISSGKKAKNTLSDKVNEEEADIAVNLCKAILNVCDKNTTIGIIAPYRNQIALIKHKLELSNITQLNDIMVDTVERYQGSQRDIIILSFCINKPHQLDFFSNLNREKTVDRKLNVALTRARQQLFLIGNDYILQQNKIYAQLIEEIGITNL